MVCNRSTETSDVSPAARCMFLSRIYNLPKIHKPDVLLRPIVSCID